MSVRDLVYQLSTSTGTGNFTLSTVTGKNTFASFGTGSANTFYYFISNRDANEWEVGLGYLSTTTTLVRSSVYASSSANGLVSFGVGTKDVTNDIPAQFQVRSSTTSVTNNHIPQYDGITGTLLKSSGVTFPIPVASGGTGSTTALDARTALGLSALATATTPLSVGNGGTGLSSFGATNQAVYTTGTTSLTTGTLPVSAGGTGATTLGSNLLLRGAGTGAISTITAGTDGQFLKLVAGLPTWAAFSGTFTVSLKSYTSTTTYNAPANLIGAIVICTGGGGGGGGVGGSATGFKVFAAGGGGAGGTAIGFFTGTQIGASQSVTIGAGGAGGSGSSAAANVGSSGSQSSFGTLLVASAGSGGTQFYSSTLIGHDAKNGGTGGAGSTGTILLTGGTGQCGFVASSVTSQSPRCYGGAGGASFWGGGGASRVISSAGTTNDSMQQAGETGAGYGSGGSGGAMAGTANTGAAGGAGRTGIVTIFEFIAA